MSAIACFSSLPQVIAAYPYWIPGVPPEGADAGRRGRAAPAAMPASAETNSRREVGDSILNFPRFHPTVFCGVRSSVGITGERRGAGLCGRSKARKLLPGLFVDVAKRTR